MKIVIFAGGSGKRFWPLSRRNYPKQFQPLIDGKSTVELMVNKIADEYGWGNIIIPTNIRLSELLKKTFPNLSEKNIIVEPVRRDLGPSVGLAMTYLKKAGFEDEPVVILWSDSFPANAENFLTCLKVGEKLIKEDPDQFIFLGEKPTFPNDNVGWIELSDHIKTVENIGVFKRKGFKYKPSLEKAKKWFEDSNFVWNTGYFISSPRYILNEYKKNAPTILKQLGQIEVALGEKNERKVIEEIYPQIEPLTFDHIVLENLSPDDAFVLKTDFGWSDPGTLYALKEFFQKSKEDNVTFGNTYLFETKDSLIYNKVDSQIATVMGLDGFVVVNTPDALLVCPKEQVVNISKMLEGWIGSERERYL